MWGTNGLPDTFEWDRVKNSNEEIQCAGEKDRIRSREKRFEVEDERTEELMGVYDTVGMLDRKPYINGRRR